MSMIKWNMGLLTGIEEIDLHHRSLIQLLNEVYQDFMAGINLEAEVIDRVFNCTAYCFDCEETWMIETAYPDFAEHKAEHELFTVRFLEIYQHHKQDSNTCVDVLLTFNNWISHHFTETDAKFGHFVEVQRLKTSVMKELASRPK